MTRIIGWNFQRKYSADGSTTQQTLLAEKKRLEGRVTEIPGLISKIQNNINLTQSDIDWLNSLNNRRRKDWEKENGKNIEQVVYDAANQIVSWKAQIDQLNTEKSRIPGQIADIDRQLAALVKGESDGLSKGLDKTTAKELGEMALKKEQNTIEHEAAMQQVELQKAQTTAAKSGMSTELKIGIVIGSIIVLAIIGYMVYQHRQAAAGMPKPIKI